MIGKFLCWIGIHKYKPHYILNLHADDWWLYLFGKFNFVEDRCSRCGHVHVNEPDNNYD